MPIHFFPAGPNMQCPKPSQRDYDKTVVAILKVSHFHGRLCVGCVHGTYGACKTPDLARHLKMIAQQASETALSSLMRLFAFSARRCARNKTKRIEERNFAEPRLCLQCLPQPCKRQVSH
jgi:hypothetical protein